MHTKRKPLWWEDKDIQPQGDPRKSQKCLQPWQWKIKWSRCRHSQFCGNTTSGLCECCCPSLCLIPAGAWLSWCLEGASFSSCLPPPSWGLPTYWKELQGWLESEIWAQPWGKAQFPHGKKREWGCIRPCPQWPRQENKGSSGKRCRSRVRNLHLWPLVCLAFEAFMGLSKHVAGWAVFLSPILA